METVLFAAWANLINRAKTHTDSEIKKIGDTLESKVKQIQIKEFPLMRQDYGKVVNKILWENNIEVKVYGAYNGTIELIGGIFASNKSIKEVHSKIYDMLKLLRFDRVNYKWYKYDDEYTYFTIDSKKDDQF